MHLQYIIHLLGCKHQKVAFQVSVEKMMIFGNQKINCPRSNFMDEILTVKMLILADL